MPLARLALPLLFMLALVACDFGSGLATGPVDNAPERLFLLDNDGFFELLGDDRTFLAARPHRAFLYDGAVSPDASRVALAIQMEPRVTETGIDFGIDLYIVEDGGEPRMIVEHENVGEVMSRPHWRPGRNELIYAILGRDADGGADLRIETVDVATGERTVLVENAVEPGLSRDGRFLAYVAYDLRTGAEVLHVLDLETGVIRELLAGPERMSNVANPAWSPDGLRIAFASADPLPPATAAGGFRRTSATLHPILRDLWLVNADGTGLRRITEIADASLSLAWSADNRHVYAIGDTGFWRIDTETGALHSLGEGNLAGRVQTLIP